LPLEVLEKVPVPIPPKPEQERIVEEIARISSLIDDQFRAIEKQLIHAYRLRQSVLKQAFSGKLVPQDPNDEPASALLERIRAERAKTQQQKEKTPKATNGAPPANGQRRRRVAKLAQGVSPGKG